MRSMSNASGSSRGEGDEQIEERRRDSEPISQVTPTPATIQNSGANILINYQGSVTQSQTNNNNSTSQLPLIPPASKITQKEKTVVQHRPPQAGSSAQRKRSRLGEEGGGQGNKDTVTKIHEYVAVANSHIDGLNQNGSRCNIGLIRLQLAECMRNMVVETTNLLARVVNLQAEKMDMQINEKEVRDKIIKIQEENRALQQQVIDLQVQKEMKEKENGVGNISYVQALTRNMGSRIADGKQMPIPQIAQSIKHAPAECIIIVKSKEKREMLTKQEQEKFRKELKEILGVEGMQNVSAVRPTRMGGHTLIFQNERGRDDAFIKLRKSEIEKGIGEEESSMIAPKKKMSRAVCKETPSDLSIEQIKKEMYGRHNPMMQQVATSQRTSKLYRTRLGVIFELSTGEMCALQAQDWRLRCDFGREIKLEEFISIQQCYACGKFGHNAHDCMAKEEICRLCAKTGHSGKTCPEKDNREAWRCVNCKRMNELKNMRLDIMHAAAQLHKCPVAQQQKQARKIQLASSGIFTTPITKNDLFKNEENMNRTMGRNGNGAPQKIGDRYIRRRDGSISAARRKEAGKEGLHRGDQRGGAKTQQFATERQEKTREEDPCYQRPIRVTRPQSADGWRLVGNRNKQKEGNGKGRDIEDQEGLNNSERGEEKGDTNLMRRPRQEEEMEYDG